MIRTLCTLAASVLLVGLLVGCDGGVETSDAPKGGKLRQAPDEVRAPPGPGDDGVSQSDSASDPASDE